MLRFPFTPEEIYRDFIEVVRYFGLSPQQGILLCCRALDELLTRERRDDTDAKYWLREERRRIRDRYPASPDWDYEAYQKASDRNEGRTKSRRNWKAPYRFVHRNEVKPLPGKWYAWYKKELLEPPMSLAPHQAFTLLVMALTKFDQEQLQIWFEEIKRAHPDTWDWGLYQNSRRAK